MARYSNKRPTTKQLALNDGYTAIYIRVSTAQQRDEGYSLDDQEKRLRAYCEAQDWRIADEHVYTDAGVSGKSTEKRMRFAAMLEAARDGRIVRIVAMKLDRMARNVREFLATVDQLKAYGCDLVLIKESFDTGTPQGRFALTMFAAMAELEASTITERVMSGKHQKASVGGFNGARTPFGYDRGDDGKFVLNDQAAIVRAMFEWFLAGETLTAIAGKLNNQNIPSADGGRWHVVTVKYVLDNGFYAGLMQWNGAEEMPGDQPAIVSRETYEAASALLKAVKRGPRPKIMAAQ